MEFSLQHDQTSLVSRNDSESVLSALERAAPDRRAGFFGPRSMTWRINRESALFLGAGRAALLQLAHPWVATAIEQHSSVMSRPIARFHNTFRIVYTMIFGTVDQALAAARSLYAVHTRIRGEMTEDIAAYRHGSHYEANEIAALRWVYATLIETAVLAYEFVQPPLTPDELATYYGETLTLAAMFGLPAAALPEDWPAFLAYCREMEQSDALGVSDNARRWGMTSSPEPDRGSSLRTGIARSPPSGCPSAFAPSSRYPLSGTMRKPWPVPGNGSPISTGDSRQSCDSSDRGTKPQRACVAATSARYPASATASGSASHSYPLPKAKPTCNPMYSSVPILGFFPSQGLHRGSQILV